MQQRIGRDVFRCDFIDATLSVACIGQNEDLAPIGCMCLYVTSNSSTVAKLMIRKLESNLGNEMSALLS